MNNDSQTNTKKNKKRKILMQLIILKLKNKIQRDALFTIFCKSTKKHHYRIRNSWQDELQNMLLENSFETTKFNSIIYFLSNKVCVEFLNILR